MTVTTMHSSNFFHSHWFQRLTMSFAGNSPTRRGADLNFRVPTYPRQFLFGSAGTHHCSRSYHAVVAKVRTLTGSHHVYLLSRRSPEERLLVVCSVSDVVGLLSLSPSSSFISVRKTLSRGPHYVRCRGDRPPPPLHTPDQKKTNGRLSRRTRLSFGDEFSPLLLPFSFFHIAQQPFVTPDSITMGVASLQEEYFDLSSASSMIDDVNQQLQDITPYFAAVVIYLQWLYVPVYMCSLKYKRHR